MDFMRILLTYMATTLLVAVESTATPSVTPVPTPGAEETPAAIVTEATAEITAEPTISVTPVPVPTISPNPKYHTLSQGDRGEDVRRLQERLIELGYLPEGSADGAYGGQTRNAVRKFQYYNSLQVDGIAGKATQTNLFENPDVMPYPGAAAETPSAEPTAEEIITPEPEEETSAPQTEQTEETALPVLTEEPENTEAPISSEEPEKTEHPVSTEEPENTGIPMPTEKPEETEVPAPSEEPENTGIPVLTEEPEETGTPAPTEKPENTATPAPTEKPEETEVPVLTEKPEETEVPVLTEKPEETEILATELPADTPEGTGNPAESTPAAEETEAVPTEIVEDVDLEDEYEDLAGWIVLNDSGAAMQWNALQDGVMVLRSPRMQIREDRIRISLDDVVQCVEDWILTDDGDTVVLEAQGYTLGLFNEDAGFAATVDGMELVTDPQDFDFVRDGHFIDIDFLTRALNGTWEWDEEEWTLMLRIPGKSVTNATD